MDGLGLARFLGTWGRLTAPTAATLPVDVLREAERWDVIADGGRSGGGALDCTR